MPKGLDIKVIIDVVNVYNGRNTETLDEFPNRILQEKYDGAFVTELLANDMSGSNFTRIYPYIKEGRMDDSVDLLCL